ncbi:hypothetical protein HanRHA438_Chr14g0645721 [Helianthus annuus]|nr:hypothetical protein HanRHA438_Chr14g0645721 [Helianthus annuus]
MIQLFPPLCSDPKIFIKDLNLISRERELGVCVCFYSKEAFLLLFILIKVLVFLDCLIFQSLGC